MAIHREFDVGDIVTVVEGPFQDHEIVAEEISGNMLKAYVYMFGQTKI